MSRIRNDYENTIWRRAVKFVYGESKELFEKSESTGEDEIKKRERNHFFAVQENHKTERGITVSKLNAYDFAKKKSYPFFKKLYPFIAGTVCVLMICLLLFVCIDLPSFGEASNPVNNEVSERYIEKGMEETGAVNIVAGMILDYRAFDTLGESHVLFLSVIVVLVLLRVDKKSETRAKAQTQTKDRDPILMVIAKVLVPVVFVFGIYVVLNGHLSPGGGFSGGAIIGAGLILFANAFGFERANKFFTRKTFLTVTTIALLFYSCSKTYSFFTGANDLHSIFGPGNPGSILSAGLILPLNIAVGAVVACTMYGFYCIFKKGEI